jgi:hypothetical protein
MPIPQIQQQEVDAILQAGGLHATGLHTWQQSANKNWLRAEIPVTGRRDLKMCIIVTANRSEPSMHSFALLLNNAFRIRGLDVNGSHRNRHTDQNKWTAQIHKHKWTDACRDRFAYTPNDITAVEITDQLVQFCAECGIACDATLGPFPARQEDFLDEV